MMIDKGLSFRESEDFIFSCSRYTDIVKKFAFGTSLLTNNLKESKFISQKQYSGSCRRNTFLILQLEIRLITTKIFR